jgi:hypothetical protein
MSQENTKTINPLMVAIAGAAVGAAATYFMRREEREKAVKKYNDIKSKAQTLIEDTKQKVETTKSDIKSWAEDMGDKAEEEAQKIESQSRRRKALAA